MTGSDLPAKRMEALGMIQRGDAVLTSTAKPFDVLAEAEYVRRVVSELMSTMKRVAEAWTFAKGMGLAAPQFGIGHAAAVVRTPDGEAITLIPISQSRGTGQSRAIRVGLACFPVGLTLDARLDGDLRAGTLRTRHREADRPRAPRQPTSVGHRRNSLAVLAPARPPKPRPARPHGHE